MNKVTFPLKQADKGSEVANLQDALLVMLDRKVITPVNVRQILVWKTGLASEQSELTYGTTTLAIVKSFQQERDFQSDGIVCRQTAAAMNKLLTEWGVLEQPLVYSIKGTIYDKTGKSVADLIIRAFDDVPHSGRGLLGTAVSDGAGRYAIVYDHSRFARPVGSGGADIIVIVYTPAGRQLYESPRHPNTSNRETIDIRLMDYPAKEETVVRSYMLRGSVVDDKGVGIVGLVVEAFALDTPAALCSGAALGGPILSGENGSYEIEISDHVSKSRIDSPIDIVLAVSNHSGKELSRTAQYDIAAKKAINIMIPAGLFEEPSEFEKLGAAILRHVERVDDLQHIKENADEQGVTYLAAGRNVCAGATLP
jgi:hypothetical protein